MIKIYHLSTCSTNKRIIKELNLPDDTIYQDIKTEQISEDQIGEMKNMSGSFESLFSKKSRKYRAEGLHEKSLSENDYRELILREYTFLKRPVLICDDKIFIGNSKAEVQSAIDYLKQK